MPKEGEALSSWLHRVAACYRMDVRELLEHNLGHGQVDDLDTAPPMPLLTGLTQRSGIGLDRLCCMSFAGWVPWLLDSLDDRIPAALETYAFQFSVLLPKRSRKTRSIASWRAWLPTQPIHRACPLCLNDPANQAVLLAWELPLMLSCPLHGCWLEAYWGAPGRFLGWENADAAPRAASDAITAMNRRTWAGQDDRREAAPGDGGNGTAGNQGWGSVRGTRYHQADVVPAHVAERRTASRWPEAAFTHLIVAWRRMAHNGQERSL